MDPDFSILHIVPPGELKPASLVRVHLSPEYNRKTLVCCCTSQVLAQDKCVSCVALTQIADPQNGSSRHKSLPVSENGADLCNCDSVQIDRIWKQRCLENSKLFNATKFRVSSVTSANDGAIKFIDFYLGLTDYKEYLGTNWAPNVKVLQEKGVELLNNSQAYLSDALGVGGSVITQDNFVVLLRRSQHCAEASALWDVPGGHAEPKNLVGDQLLQDIDILSMYPSAVVDEIFNSITQEVIAEVNIPAACLEAPLYMGTHRNLTSAGRPSLAFLIRCSLTRQEVKSLYCRGDQQEADETTSITFVACSEVPCLSRQNPELWSQLAPSAKGNLTILSLALGL